MKKYDVVIIGGGPAGITSAIYVMNSGLSCLVIEKSAFGGQVVNSADINNYPGLGVTSGSKLSDSMFNHFIELKGKFDFGCVDEINYDQKYVLLNNKEIHYNALILCMGAKAKTLDVKGEKEFTGKGVSYCAICDGALYKDKELYIVGGGSSALEESIYLSDVASKVNILVRKDYFRAKQYLIDKVLQKQQQGKINVLFNTSIEEIIGQDKIAQLQLNNNVTNEKTLVNLDGLFIAIGRLPDNMLGQQKLQLNEFGYIISDQDMKTNIEGVFVAGDIRDKRLRQIATAVGDGAIAGTMASEYVKMHCK